MFNAVLCKSCGNLIHGRCAKMVINRLAIDFKCWKCKEYHKNVVDQKKKLHDNVETVKECSYLGDIINSGGKFDVAVTSRTSKGWAKFRKCQDLHAVGNFL